MAVLRPLKVVIDNYPEGQVEELDAVNNPEDPSAGTRKVPFCRVLYIEQDDFREDPPKQFFRLAPGKEVRLRWAYFIKCNEVVKDAAGDVVELRCTYDPATKRRQRAGRPQGERDDPLGLAPPTPSPAEVRLYDHLFKMPNPDDVPEGAGLQGEPEPEFAGSADRRCVEPSLAGRGGRGRSFSSSGSAISASIKDSTPEKLVFNRAVTLADTWAKMQRKG